MLGCGLTAFAFRPQCVSVCPVFVRRYADGAHRAQPVGATGFVLRARQRHSQLAGARIKVGYSPLTVSPGQQSEQSPQGPCAAPPPSNNFNILLYIDFFINHPFCSSRHLMEQPMLGICSAGPSPISATCFMASNRSRRAPSGAVSLRLASRRPRYWRPRSAL